MLLLGRGSGLFDDCADEYAAAVEDYSRVLSVEADNLDALFQRGSAHEKLGDIDSALSDFSTVLRLDGNHAKALYARGACHNLKGGLCSGSGCVALAQSSVQGSSSSDQMEKHHCTHSLSAESCLHCCAEDYAAALEKDKIQQTVPKRRRDPAAQPSSTAPQAILTESQVSLQGWGFPPFKLPCALLFGRATCVLNAIF